MRALPNIDNVVYLSGISARQILSTACINVEVGLSLVETLALDERRS